MGARAWLTGHGPGRGQGPAGHAAQGLVAGDLACALTPGARELLQGVVLLVAACAGPGLGVGLPVPRTVGFFAGGLDLGVPGGEGFQEAVVDAVDLPVLPPGARDGAHLPLHPQARGQRVHEVVVVGLAQGDLGGHERATGVQGAPAPVGALDPVGDHEVGVQVRVALAGVPVVERRRDDAARLCLDDSPGALAGTDGVGLHHVHDVIDRVVVSGLDLLAHAGIPQRPHHRHGLGWGEGEVEAVHRLGLVGARDLPLDLLDARCALIGAQLSAQVGGERAHPVSGGHVSGERAPERPVGDRVGAVLDERAQLVGAHPPPGVQVAVIVAQAVQAAAQPPPGGRARVGVVAGPVEVRMLLLGGAVGDGLDQVVNDARALPAGVVEGLDRNHGRSPPVTASVRRLVSHGQACAHSAHAPSTPGTCRRAMSAHARAAAVMLAARVRAAPARARLHAGEQYT